MNRRIWTGILAGVLAATVILGVAGTAYRIGQSHDVAITRTVGDGEVVRVVGGYGGWGYGHGGGFVLFPLFAILVIFLLFRGARGGGYGGRWGGPCGPGDRFEEHHRRAHEADQAG